jgi:hypothetical protein
MWAVETCLPVCKHRPRQAAPAGVSTCRQQFGMHPPAFIINILKNKKLNSLPDIKK